MCIAWPWQPHGPCPWPCVHHLAHGQPRALIKLIYTLWGRSLHVPCTYCCAEIGLFSLHASPVHLTVSSGRVPPDLVRRTLVTYLGLGLRAVVLFGCSCLHGVPHVSRPWQDLHRPWPKPWINLPRVCSWVCSTDPRSQHPTFSLRQRMACLVEWRASHCAVHAKAAQRNIDQRVHMEMQPQLKPSARCCRLGWWWSHRRLILAATPP